MGWSPERPVPVETILPPPGWYPGSPEPTETITRVGWWAVLALDTTAVTVHWIAEVELEFITGLGLEIVSLHTTRALALQKLGMVAMQRNIEVTSPLALQGIYLTSLSLNAELDRALLLERIGIAHLGQALTLDRTLGLVSVKPIDVPAALAVSSAFAMTPVKPIDLAQTITTTRTLGLGITLPIAFDRTINVSGAVGFGFPPTAEVTDTYGTAVEGNSSTSNEAFTHNIRRWCNFMDEVLLGGGGSGQASAALFNVGKGGGPGEWSTRTFQRGVDISYQETQVTGTMGGGAPSSPGPSILGGSPGKDTTSSLGSTAGGGYAGLLWGSATGIGPGTINYNGKPYVGGANATGSQNGKYPGGGGTGSSGFSSSRPGARGRAWYRSYQ
ncbi:minor tail protein [Mycobacterium phage Thonko]|uniref:Minor tail protein n=1 Tax=Mycobacterium phage Thonko TaxID=2282910 RepID=A0A346FC77_9CAUD|nr:minor tail protein [Mycobacterium phage Thonko]AXN53302.1 minor tail protein [Mycobacterium phage Thonko]